MTKNVNHNGNYYTCLFPCKIVTSESVVVAFIMPNPNPRLADIQTCAARNIVQRTHTRMPGNSKVKNANLIVMHIYLVRAQVMHNSYVAIPFFSRLF